MVLDHNDGCGCSRSHGCNVLDSYGHYVMFQFVIDYWIVVYH